jgi:hypothetical protein
LRRDQAAAFALVVRLLRAADRGGSRADHPIVHGDAEGGEPAEDRALHLAEWRVHCFERPMRYFA